MSAIPGFKEQSDEFDAVRELSNQWNRITLTPIVDDDYPRVRADYERAVKNFLIACKANGRIEGNVT